MFIFADSYKLNRYTAMNGNLLAILMLLGVLAFISFLVFIGIYARKQNKAVNEMKMPPNIEQIRRKSRWFALAVMILSLVFAYFFVFGK